MKTLFEILSFVHIVGVVAIAWGVFSAWKSRGINAAMLHGASTQFLTGILMVAIAGPAGEDFDMAKIAIKLAVVLAMLAVIVKGRRAKGDTTMWWAAVGVLWLINVGVGTTLGG